MTGGGDQTHESNTDLVKKDCAVGCSFHLKRWQLLKSQMLELPQMHPQGG